MEWNVANNSIRNLNSNTNLNKTISDNVLVFELDARVAHQPHHRRVVHEYLTRVRRARYRLTLHVQIIYCISQYKIHWFNGNIVG